MSTDSTNTLDYWTSVSKTQNERYIIARDFTNLFRKSVNGRKQSSNLRSIRFFDRLASSAEDLVYTLDSYSYHRSLTPQVIDGLLIELGISSQPEKYLRTPFRTEFMYEGLKIVLYHTLSGEEDRGRYIDVATQALYYGYNRIVDVFNILLRGSGFYVDEQLDTYFKSESGREFRVGDMGETPAKLLGMKQSVYTQQTYSSFRNIDELTDWFMQCRFVNLASFHFNTEKQYVGPDDYFGSELFQKIVENIQSRAMNTLDTTSMLTATIKRKQLEWWQASNSRTYKAYTDGVESEKRNALINSKLTDELIREIVSNEADDIFIKSFRSSFESAVAEKEDFTFFVLSSSEETLKNRMSELHQKLTG